MAKQSDRARLKIAMNGEPVGILTQLSGGGLEFQYDPTWLEHPQTRPLSLSLPLNRIPYKSEAVYNFFDNLLPDNVEIRNQIQTQFHAKTKRPFDLLAKIGRDCVGAIQLLPEGDSESVKTIKAKPVSNSAIGKMIEQYTDLPLGMNDDEDFRISLAGAQMKTALLKWNNKWYKPLGVTPTTHILKFPIGIRRTPSGQIDLSHSVENEWLCMMILKNFGLTVPRVEIKNFSGHQVLVVERFDRMWSVDKSWIIRLPQEDFCQVFGVAPALKYQTDGGPGIQAIMDKLAMSKTPELDRKQFFAAQFLFWLLAAPDGHAKNFSIFLRDGGSYQLTPFYDVISAYPLLKARQLRPEKLKLAMALSSTKNHYLWNDIVSRYWESTAKRCRFYYVHEVISEILEQVEDAIARTIKVLPSNFPDSIATPILTGLKKTANGFI